jgi:PadR family transcriptional regulator PadR
MSKRRSNPPFLNGVPELLVLQLLDSQPMHGYELVQAIKASTGHAFGFGEGCVYPILHRLESDGLLRANQTLVAGRSRVVYQVTKSGRKRLTESVATWRRVVNAVNGALQGSKSLPGGEDGQQALA